MTLQLNNTFLSALSPQPTLSNTVVKSASGTDVNLLASDIGKTVVVNQYAYGTAVTIPVSTVSSNQANVVQIVNGGVPTMGTATGSYPLTNQPGQGFTVWTSDGNNCLAYINTTNLTSGIYTSPQATFHCVSRTIPAKSGTWAVTDKSSLASATPLQSYVRSSVTFQWNKYAADGGNAGQSIVQLDTNIIVVMAGTNATGGCYVLTWNGTTWVQGVASTGPYNESSSVQVRRGNSAVKITTTKFLYMSVVNLRSYNYVGTVTGTGASASVTFGVGSYMYASSADSADQWVAQFAWPNIWVANSTTLRACGETLDPNTGFYWASVVTYSIGATTITYSSTTHLSVTSSRSGTAVGFVYQGWMYPTPTVDVGDNVVITWGDITATPWPVRAIVWNGSQKGTDTSLSGATIIGSTNTSTSACLSAYAGSNKFVAAFTAQVAASPTGGVNQATTLLYYLNYDVNFTSGAITANTLYNLSTFNGAPVNPGYAAYSYPIGWWVFNDTAGEAMMTMSPTFSQNGTICAGIRGDKIGSAPTFLARFTTSGSSTTLADWWGIGTLNMDTNYKQNPNNQGPVIALDTTGSAKYYTFNAYNALNSLPTYQYVGVIKWDGNQLASNLDNLPFSGTPQAY